MEAEMSDWIKEIESPTERKWEEFYRNRFQHDRVGVGGEGSIDAAVCLVAAGIPAALGIEETLKRIAPA